MLVLSLLRIMLTLRCCNVHGQYHETLSLVVGIMTEDIWISVCLWLICQYVLPSFCLLLLGEINYWLPVSASDCDFSGSLHKPFM
jgi:hypothetical protein